MKFICRLQIGSADLKCAFEASMESLIGLSIADFRVDLSCGMAEKKRLRMHFSMTVCIRASMFTLFFQFPLGNRFTMKRFTQSKRLLHIFSVCSHLPNDDDDDYYPGCAKCSTILLCVIIQLDLLVCAARLYVLYVHIDRQDLFVFDQKWLRRGSIYHIKFAYYTLDTIYSQSALSAIGCVCATVSSVFTLTIQLFYQWNAYDSQQMNRFRESVDMFVGILISIFRTTF